MRNFSLFVHTLNSEAPTLLLGLWCDPGSAIWLAERALAESPDRLLVEVREDDRLRFSLDRNGVSWTDAARRAKSAGA
jgi:hypothetical protein